MNWLDTNVISELRKVGDGKADTNVVQWVSSIDAASSDLSVVTIMELEIGILRVERRDQRQGAMLRAWLENHVLPEFADRTLSIDAAVARCCALVTSASERLKVAQTGLSGKSQGKT